MKSHRCSNRLDVKKPKEITLMIDSKILDDMPATSSPFNQTLKTPLSTLSLNTFTKAKPNTNNIVKSPSNADLNSTVKIPPSRSNSKSDRSRDVSLNRSKSLSSMSSSAQSIANVLSKETNLKCFEKLVFKITDYMQNLPVCWEFTSLSYQNVLALLHCLYYIPYPTEAEMHQNNLIKSLRLCYEFWVNLTGTLYSTLTNFVYLLCVVENIDVEYHLVQMAIDTFMSHLYRRGVIFQIEQQHCFEFKFVGSPVISKWDARGNLSISKAQRLRLRETLKGLKINRLSHQDKKVVEQKTTRVELSEKTVKLASSKRQKIETIIRNRQPEIEKITLSDILNFKQDIPTSVVPLSARSYLEHKTKSRGFVSSRPKLKLNRKICPMVEMLSQPKMVVAQNKEDLQFERNRKECTFQPTIHSLKIVKSKQLFHIKNVVKTLERMKESRQFKMEEKKQRDTGWTNIKTSKSKQRDEDIRRPLSDRRQCSSTTSNKEDQLVALSQPEQVKETKADIRIPLLFIDINIDQNQKQRLVIYQQDSSEELAASFSKKHNLTQEMELKLRDLLDFQMNSILTKIEEEAEEEELL